MFCLFFNPDKTNDMEIPNYTEMEERLLRENRDLREKIKRQEREILDGITNTGIWVKKLEDKSRQVCELLDKYEPDEYGQNAKRIHPPQETPQDHE